MAEQPNQQPNQDSDRKQPKPQSDSPGQRNEVPKPQRKLGDDPDSEGTSNESLPEGSNQPREKNPTQRRAEDKLDHHGATGEVQKRKTVPSDLFNGA